MNETSAMTDSRQEIAVQRALLMPEILSAVLIWITLDEFGDIHHGYGPGGVLARCGLVSKLWFNEAIPYLWRDLTMMGYMYHHLSALFALVEPTRRQFYANFVETATIVTLYEDRPREEDDALRGVAFPKLKSLCMRLGGRRQIHVPMIESHRVTALEID